MAANSKILLREARNLAVFLLISILHSRLACPRCTGEQFVYILSLTFVIWLSLWKGNSAVSRYLTQRISWVRFPLRRLVTGLLLHTIFTVLVVLALIAIFESVSPMSLGRGIQYTVLGSVIITLLICIVLHAREFLIFWRRDAFDKEKFEKESVIARYETLKSQVSPHFLFNSLNALSNLVYEDSEKAEKFIGRLSDVYRYVLETREKEVVSLAEELRFLDAYLYLQTIRFGPKLITHIAEMTEGLNIPPLALQMLVENALKHNIVSDEHPLTISIYCENGFAVVENNLQRRSSAEDSSQVGLENIRNRYQHLTDKEMFVEENTHTFKVKLPLLSAEI